jgi:hypothetical protein
MIAIPYYLVLWAVVAIFYTAPLLHVALSPAGGPFEAGRRSSWPFGPRALWFVAVIFFGAIAWPPYMLFRHRLARAMAPPETNRSC